jgi:hypothetical protein
MNKIILLLTFLTTSCVNHVFTDNSGKCFKGYFDSRGGIGDTHLVFNKYDDYIDINKYSRIYGPYSNNPILDKVEVSCPKSANDMYGLATEAFKNQGIYDEVSSYIKIIIK